MEMRAASEVADAGRGQNQLSHPAVASRVTPLVPGQVAAAPGPAVRHPYLASRGYSVTSLLLVFLASHALSGGPDGDQEATLPIEKSAAATIHLKGYPDWLEI